MHLWIQKYSTKWFFPSIYICMNDRRIRKEQISENCYMHNVNLNKLGLLTNCLFLHGIERKEKGRINTGVTEVGHVRPKKQGMWSIRTKVVCTHPNPRFKLLRGLGPIQWLFLEGAGSLSINKLSESRVISEIKMGSRRDGTDPLEPI